MNAGVVIYEKSVGDLPPPPVVVRASFFITSRMPAPHLYEHSHNQINRPVYPLCGSVPESCSGPIYPG